MLPACVRARLQAEFDSIGWLARGSSELDIEAVVKRVVFKPLEKTQVRDTG